MRLTQPAPAHLKEMMGWFPSEPELRVWAGPGFRYPFDAQSFEADLEMNRLASHCLVEGDALLAFGQYYNRLDRCHLGRLVVSPAQRGKGIVGALIGQLSELGRRRLGTQGYSLFVLGDNLGARAAYERLGFAAAEYPGEMPLENCLYMTKPES